MVTVTYRPEGPRFIAGFLEWVDSESNWHREVVRCDPREPKPVSACILERAIAIGDEGAANSGVGISFAERAHLIVEFYLELAAKESP